MTRSWMRRRVVVNALERRLLLAAVAPVELDHEHGDEHEHESLVDSAVQERYAAHFDRTMNSFVEIKQVANRRNNAQSRASGDGARASGDAGPNLAVTQVYMSDIDAVRVDTPAVGTNAFMFATFTTTDLPAGASYTIRMSVGGVARTVVATNGAGLSGTRTWTVHLGDWIITTGFKSATVGLDTTGAVTETSEIDNSGIASFTPPVFTAKFTQPLEGTVGTDFTINNYSDMNLTPGVASDYLGGPYQYDGHDAWDIVPVHFGPTDGGYEIYAAAPGTVITAHDGEFDRNVDTQGQRSNYIAIDHGGGWVTYYHHLRRDSVAVSVGDTVTRGEEIGYMGSSGNSSEAHLHWSVYYNGMRVEPMVAESSYMVTPLGYSGLTKNIMTSGIHGHGTLSYDDYKERQTTENVFHPGDRVHYWASVAGVRDSGTVTRETRGPSGTIIAEGTGNEYIHQWAAYELPSNAALGNYTVRWLIDGVVKSVDSFSVQATASLTPPEHYLNAIPKYGGTSFKYYVADNRWTPIDAGIRYQTYDNRPADFWDLEFYVENKGEQTMTTSSLSVPSGFSTVNGLAASITTADYMTFRLNDSATTGRKVGYVSYDTNDADINEANMRFRIEGTIASVNPLTVFVPHYNDEVYIRRSGSNTHVWINTDTDEPATIVMPVSATTQWLIATGEGDDTITFDYSGGNPLADYAIIAPGESEEADGDKLVVIGAATAENIKIYGTSILVGASDVRFAGFEHVRVNGSGGSDEITVGGTTFTDDLDLNSLNLTIDGGTGTDTLIFDDSQDSDASNYSLSNSYIDRIGAFAGPVAITDFSHVRVDAGSGNNVFSMSSAITTTINFTINAGLGNDRMNFTNGDMGLFAGAVTFNGNGGTDTIGVVDYDAAAGQTYTLEGSSLSRTGSGGVTFATTEAMDLFASPLDDTIIMTGAVDGFAPTIHGSVGDDLIQIQGMFTGNTAVVEGNAGNDTLDVNTDDSGTARVRIETPETFGAVRIGAGGYLTLAADNEGNTLRTAALTVDVAGELNITDNAVIVNWSLINPLSLIEDDVAAGYANGAWNGKGIRSSTAAVTAKRTVGTASGADLSPATITALGGGIDTSTVVIRYTVLGDLNLDRVTNFDDLLGVAQGYGVANRRYGTGNLNYSANDLVTFDDLLLVAQGYGTAWSVEPTATSTRRVGRQMWNDVGFVGESLP